MLQNIKCYHDQTGVIEARPFGGLPPYLYQWSNGSEVYKIQNSSNPETINHCCW
ncbi:MAG: SprB repeat-containing protein [Saprospiraceae bacterium]|nr:SprB repeat-containing protein [Saprospiraceae bacterium]